MFSSQNTLKTGIYRANGSVANWKFRITLRKIYSLIEIPRFDSSIDAKPIEEPPNSEEEHLDIRWQEKVFSKYEIDYYSAKDNCHTELQKSYHHTIKSSRLTEQDSRGKIFTYTAADNFAPDEDVCEKIQSQRIHLDEEQLNMETMFVMADLDTEVLLFSLYWNSTEKSLFVYPDFNCMKINPYYKEIQGDSRQMYHFGLKNLSSKEQIAGSNETIQIRDVLAEKITRLNIRHELSKDNFEYPENHQQQFLILLEIISGTGFSYSDTYIRYRFDTPPAANIINGILSGSTHCTKQANGSWVFGHCHDLSLQMPENYNIDDCVRVYFDIISTDSWKRERLLGNAYLQVSLSNNTTERNLTCIKVSNNGTLYDKLEAFLVGGRREVKTPNFYGQTDSFLLNRYGSRAEQSGHLKIKCQVIQQQRPHIIHISTGTKKRNKFNSNLVTIEGLLSSYQQARERLEEIVKLNY